ncbi:MAG: hypothetical protein NC127_01215 [Muribaculum sp.]|nr:hypothetical protein [Muribaculum sp.]
MNSLRILYLIFFLAVMPELYGKKLVDKLPPTSPRIEGYVDQNEVRQRMSQMPLHIIEGIWQFPSDGAVVAIERHTPGNILADGAVRYRMVILRSPVRSIRPGTVMGYVAATSKQGVYAAHVYTSAEGSGRLIRPKDFTFTLIDDGHLSFRVHSASFYTNVWRMIPYLSRISFRVRSADKPKDLDGCTRLYPEPLSGPIEPRYL